MQSFPLTSKVGDLFMNLIHTCQLADVNSFDYLTELQRHAGELAPSPSNWMPRNYRERLTHSPPKWPENEFPKRRNPVTFFAR